MVAVTRRAVRNVMTERTAKRFDGVILPCANRKLLKPCFSKYQPSKNILRGLRGAKPLIKKQTFMQPKRLHSIITQKNLFLSYSQKRAANYRYIYILYIGCSTVSSPPNLPFHHPCDGFPPFFSLPFHH
jgi:hypothetical protein